MAAPADVVFTGGEVHTLTDPDRVAEAVAVRNGRIVRVADDYEIRFLSGAETRTVDLDGGVLLPGFVDAHTHMLQRGLTLLHADLAGAPDRETAIDRLREDGTGPGEWILGFGWDESEWPSGRPLDREALDRVAEDRPVAAFRVDLHSVALNGAALARVGDDVPDEHRQTADGDPTGVVVESGVDVVQGAVDLDREATTAAIRAAVDDAQSRGLTGVHDMVRRSQAPRAYRDLDAADDLGLRVRINYWSDHLDAMEELGLRPNHGSEFVRVGAVKTFTDGSIGSHTAKVTEAYADAPGETGEWVVDPEAVEALIARASEEDRQVAAHAIGDVAIESTIDALETVDADRLRHRIEHLELIEEEDVERLAETGAVASVQPNFHRWADEDGLYDRRLGAERRLGSNPLRELSDAGVPLAFGSDGMPMDPLYGVERAVGAPAPEQRLSVTEALRAYTRGSAYAGFDEHRMGTVEPGKVADFVVLAESPWEHPDRIGDIDVAMTVVDGTIVHDGRD